VWLGWARVWLAGGWRNINERFRDDDDGNLLEFDVASDKVQGHPSSWGIYIRDGSSAKIT